MMFVVVFIDCMLLCFNCIGYKIFLVCMVFKCSECCVYGVYYWFGMMIFLCQEIDCYCQCICLVDYVVCGFDGVMFDIDIVVGVYWMCICFGMFVVCLVVYVCGCCQILW